jgi:hypothetical protein
MDPTNEIVVGKFVKIQLPRGVSVPRCDACVKFSACETHDSVNPRLAFLKKIVRGAFEDLPKDGTDGDELPPLESHLGGLRRSSDFFETFDFAARFLILWNFFSTLTLRHVRPE